MIQILIMVSVFVTSCNDEVFVTRQEPQLPPDEQPEPEPPGDESTDRLILRSLDYIQSTLGVSPNDVTTQSKTNFVNNTSSAITVSIFYDQYNKSYLTIENSTHYVIPWSDDQPLIEIPGLNSEGVAGFYGVEVPFKFGKSIVPAQYMPGYEDLLELPPYSQVSATVSVTRQAVIATADIKYYINNYPDSADDTGWVSVKVEVPVDINVEWGDVTEIK